MPKAIQYIETIGTALVSLVTSYENLGPEAKTFLSNELAAVEAEISTVKTALDTFAADSSLGKLTDIMGLASVLGGVVKFVETTFANGEQLFASDWPTIKADIAPVLALFGVAEAVPSTAPATEPTAAPSEPVVVEQEAAPAPAEEPVVEPVVEPAPETPAA